METERIALSQRERDRLRVLREVQEKQITQIEAARRLKISDRQIRRLLFGLGERRLDGSHWLRFRGRYLRLRHCPNAEPRAVSPSGLRPPGLTANPLSKVHKGPPANHPWRTFQ